jgi:pimeloyl-ACP methyl ester carboxylesterase
VKFFFLTVLTLLLYSCNLAEWNQKRLTKKFNRNGIEESYFISEKDSIHYFEGGQGETILLLHGFGGDAQVTWYKTVLDLSKDYHVICPDLLWFGKSVSTRTPNLKAQVNSFCELMDSKQKDPFHVAGISYGGFVALGIQNENVNRIKSMCIIDSPGYTFDVRFIDSLCAKQNVKSIDEIFVVKTPQQVQKLTNLAVYKDRKIPKKMLTALFEIYFNKNHSEQKELLLSLLRNADELKSEAKMIFPRALVIWGEEDEIFHISEGKKLAKYLNAEFKSIPEVGHAPNIENFKVFEAIYRKFLSGSK